jgi:hypothetical protein
MGTMREFTEADDLRGARFASVDLSGARFRGVNLQGVKMVDALLVDADVSGLIIGMKVNGVEVLPLVAAELERQHPERKTLFVSDPEGLRKAWSFMEGEWAATTQRARELPEAALHERVDEEWSFVETLRHLIFVIDGWISRVVVGDPSPYDPIALPPTFVGDGRDLGIDPDADPSLAETLAVREARVATVRELLARADAAELDRVCGQNEATGYPPETQHTVLQCVHTVIDEEWAHHQYAVRDLAVLESEHQG